MATPATFPTTGWRTVGLAAFGVASPDGKTEWFARDNGTLKNLGGAEARHVFGFLDLLDVAGVRACSHTHQWAATGYVAQATRLTLATARPAKQPYGPIASAPYKSAVHTALWLMTRVTRRLVHVRLEYQPEIEAAAVAKSGAMLAMVAHNRATLERIDVGPKVCAGQRAQQPHGRSRSTGDGQQAKQPNGRSSPTGDDVYDDAYDGVDGGHHYAGPGDDDEDDDAIGGGGQRSSPTGGGGTDVKTRSPPPPVGLLRWPGFAYPVFDQRALLALEDCPRLASFRPFAYAGVVGAATRSPVPRGFVTVDETNHQILRAVARSCPAIRDLELQSTDGLCLSTAVVSDILRSGNCFCRARSLARSLPSPPPAARHSLWRFFFFAGVDGFSNATRTAQVGACRGIRV